MVKGEKKGITEIQIPKLNLCQLSSLDNFQLSQVFLCLPYPDIGVAKNVKFCPTGTICINVTGV